MTPKEKADQARTMLESPVFKEMLEDVERVFVRKLKDADLSNDRKTALLVMALQLLDQFPSRLRKFVADGEFEELRLKRERYPASVRDKYGS